MGLPARRRQPARCGAAATAAEPTHGRVRQVSPALPEGMTLCMHVFPVPRPAPALCSCPAGYETRLEGAGAAECPPCAAGFFATAPNTPFCAKCEPGTFANSTGGRGGRQGGRLGRSSVKKCEQV